MGDVISDTTAQVMIALNVLMMVAATAKTVMNKLSPAKLETYQCLLDDSGNVVDAPHARSDLDNDPHQELPQLLTGNQSHEHCSDKKEPPMFEDTVRTVQSPVEAQWTE